MCTHAAYTRVAYTVYHKVDLLSKLLDVVGGEQSVGLEVVRVGHEPGYQLVKEVAHSMRDRAIVTEIEERNTLSQLWRKQACDSHVTIEGPCKVN